MPVLQRLGELACDLYFGFCFSLSYTHRRRLFFFLHRAKDELPLSPPLFSLSPPLLSLPLAVGPKYSSAPADKRFGAYWSQNVQLWWLQFSLIFLRTNVIFCRQTSLISYGVTICIIDCQCSWVQFLTGRRPMMSFYRAMLCIRGTSLGPVSVSVSVSVSVCQSVISRSSTKTAKRRITQTTPHDTPKTLVF